jgi:anti-sigma B factor antagonist
MQLHYSELQGGIRLIKLSGVLDGSGTSMVEVDFVRRCQGENVRVLVDLARVNYISSIGIALLSNSAKSVVSHGGKFALLRPQNSVRSLLEMTGIPLIIPIYADFKKAIIGLKK